MAKFKITGSITIDGEDFDPPLTTIEQVQEAWDGGDFEPIEEVTIEKV